MRRYFAPLFILIAIMAASCGSTDTTVELEAGGLPAPTADDGGSETSPPSDDTTDIDGGVERYLIAAAEQSAQIDAMRFSLEMAMGGLAEMGGQEVAIVVSGAVSDDGSTGELVMDMSSMMDAIASDPTVDGAEFAAIFADPIEVRYDGSRVYMSSSFISWLVPVETPWVTFVDTGGGGAADMAMSTDQVDPQELLVLLRGLGDDAEIVGTEEIDGVTTTHVQGRFSAANVLDAGADLGGMEEMLAGLDLTGTTEFELAVLDVDVWIGDDGIVRRLRFGVDDLAALDPTADPGAYMEVIMELTDIGEPVEITIPPDDQVTDIDDLGVGNLFG